MPPTPRGPFRGHPELDRSTHPGASGRSSSASPRSPWSGGAPSTHHGEASLEAALAAGPVPSAVRYRGFVLLPQSDLGWLVRPERSPMTVLPFRTPPISLSDVKALVDWRLDGARLDAQE